MENETVTLTISKPEALILSELLADFRSQPELLVSDDAERLSLWALACALEKTLVEPFLEDYDGVIAKARADLIRRCGESVK